MGRPWESRPQGTEGAGTQAKLKTPVHEPRREMQILENIRRWNSGPLDDAALQRVFERIIDEGRAIQRGAMGEPRKD